MTPTDSAKHFSQIKGASLIRKARNMSFDYMVRSLFDTRINEWRWSIYPPEFDLKTDFYEAVLHVVSFS